MNLFGHHHHHDDNPWDGARPRDIEIREMLRFIIRRIYQMSVDTAKLLADVTAQRTVLDGLVVFVQGQNASNADQAKQIEDLKAALAAASVNDPAVQAAVDAIDATVQSNTALAQGVLPAATANTPTPPAEAAAAAEAAATPVA